MNKLLNKTTFNFEDLCLIMKELRSENGCPWDKAQTNESIKDNLIEEAYEVFDAIENKDDENLREELGDLLLQVVFHAQIKEQSGKFNIDDVINELCKKLIFRHPHVFGSKKASDASEALDTWNEQKKIEKNQNTYTDTLKAVPRHFPALLRAQKVQKRAKKAGFDWDDKFLALEKVFEEANELKAEMQKENSLFLEEELGDLIFSAVNVARFINVNSEDALNKATEKFINRFSLLEQKANDQNIDISKTSLEELDKLWEQVKNNN